MLDADATFVCPACWKIFADSRARACPDCAGAPPAGGWQSMPCSFRGRYLLTEQIGRDAASALFLARIGDDGEGGEPAVLLEVARTRGPVASPAIARKLFRREAMVAGLLAEETDAFFGLASIDVTDPAFIAFEHVPWPALSDLLAEAGTFPPVAAARVGVAILHGVSALERNRLVHRAIVPSRVFALRSEDGGYDVKIAGFGVWPDGEEAMAKGADILPYASPEQLSGEPLDTASDVHMVASILWELVTGQVPYPLLEGPIAEAEADRLRRLARVPQRPAAMPAELHELLAVALRADPRERSSFPTGSRARSASPAEALGSALERFAEEFPKQRDRELAGALRELGVTSRSLAALDTRLAPLRSILERKVELEATVRRLAADPGGPGAVRAGARAAEEALAELEADVGRLLSRAADPAADTHAREEPSRDEPSPREPVRRESVRKEPVRKEPVSREPVRSEPVRVAPPRREPVREEPAGEPSHDEPSHDEPLRDEPSHEEPAVVGESDPPPSPVSKPPISSQPAFPPPSKRPPDSLFPRGTTPDSMFPKGTSVPPDSMDRLEIPGVGGRRWPYFVAVVAAIAAVIAGSLVLTGGKGGTAPGASASALAPASAPTPFGAPPSASASAPAAPAVSVSAAPAVSASASAAPTASATAAPRPKPRPPPKPRDEEAPSEE